MTRPPLNILVAEDDPGHRELLVRSLSRHWPAPTIRTVDSGDAFLKEARRDPPDCAIIDYCIPPYDAHQLMAAARKYLGDRPILVVSSSREQLVVINSIRGGAVDFMPKADAIRPERLWRCLERAIWNYRRRQNVERRQQQRTQQLVEMADKDPLTGLYNRRFLERNNFRVLDPTERRRSQGYVMIDLDWFKRVNDTYGHSVGDGVLKQAAALIQDHTNSSDVAIRWGGEEFLVIRSGRGLSETMIWAEQLRKRMAQGVVQCQDRSIRFTASFGVSVCDRGSDAAGAVERADEALYLAKRHGRNRVCTWDMVMAEQILARVRQQSFATPSARRDAFVRQSAAMLGPTQFSHITEHCQRVADTAWRLGQALRLPPVVVNQLHLAGLMHDIGKSVIPEDVLAQRDELTDDERNLIGQHADWGARMSLLLGADGDCAEIVRKHHMPRSKRGNSLTSHAASVLSVADAYVAMTSNRPYRSRRTPSVAMEELRRCQGEQFEPAVVRAMESIMA